MAKLMTIDVEMYCSNEYVDNVPTHTRLAFDASTMAYIRKARKAIKDLEAYNISRWDNVQTFLYENDDEELIEKKDPQEAFRAECEQLIVTDTDVYWEGYVKNVDNSSWSTDHISYKELNECWKVFKAKEESLPLYINHLEYDTAKAVLKERMIPHVKDEQK